MQRYLYNPEPHNINAGVGRSVSVRRNFETTGREHYRCPGYAHKLTVVFTPHAANADTFDPLALLKALTLRTQLRGADANEITREEISAYGAVIKALALGWCEDEQDEFNKVRTIPADALQADFEVVFMLPAYFSYADTGSNECNVGDFVRYEVEGTIPATVSGDAVVKGWELEPFTEERQVQSSERVLASVPVIMAEFSPTDTKGAVDKGAFITHLFGYGAATRTLGAIAYDIRRGPRVVANNLVGHDITYFIEKGFAPGNRVVMLDEDNIMVFARQAPNGKFSDILPGDLSIQLPPGTSWPASTILGYLMPRPLSDKQVAVASNAAAEEGNTLAVDGTSGQTLVENVPEGLRRYVPRVGVPMKRAVQARAELQRMAGARTAKLAGFLR